MARWERSHVYLQSCLVVHGSAVLVTILVRFPVLPVGVAPFLTRHPDLGLVFNIAMLVSYQYPGALMMKISSAHPPGVLLIRAGSCKEHCLEVDLFGTINTN